MSNVHVSEWHGGRRDRSPSMRSSESRSRAHIHARCQRLRCLVDLRGRNDTRINVQVAPSGTASASEFLRATDARWQRTLPTRHLQARHTGLAVYISNACDTPTAIAVPRYNLHSIPSFIVPRLFHPTSDNHISAHKQLDKTGHVKLMHVISTFQIVRGKQL